MTTIPTLIFTILIFYAAGIAGITATAAGWALLHGGPTFPSRLLLITSITWGIGLLGIWVVLRTGGAE